MYITFVPFIFTEETPWETNKQRSSASESFQLKFALTNQHSTLDMNISFPLHAIRVYRANPDVFPFPAPKLLEGDWDKYATDGKKQWV